MQNCLHAAPIPDGAAQDYQFDVCVRLQQGGECQQVQTYAAKVDMHDVRQCAVAVFEASGPVEVQVTPCVSWVYEAVVRPLSLHIQAAVDGHKVCFTMEKNADVMVEINGERFHCLHLFNSAPVIAPAENAIYLDASRPGPHTVPVRELRSRLAELPQGRALVLGPGLHIIEEYLFPVPSHTIIHLALGAVVLGGFVIDQVSDVRIEGNGILLQAGIHRYSGINGVRISHSHDISISDVTFIDPAHYTICLGESKDISLQNIRSFSCEGWSDGIDMMSCCDVHVERCFLRTSDDCIAIYGQRWDYHGDSRNILIENCTLWADVAHPINMGTHGDYAHEGNIIEDVTFRNIDILEHHEYQPDYLGCLAINAGDKNVVRDVLFENIRIEQIEHGRLMDVQVKCNPDYNPAPGQRIENIVFRNVRCACKPSSESVVAGFSDTCRVTGVQLHQVLVEGQMLCPRVGQYADHITSDTLLEGLR